MLACGPMWPRNPARPITDDVAVVQLQDGNSNTFVLFLTEIHGKPTGPADLERALLGYIAFFRSDELPGDNNEVVLVVGRSFARHGWGPLLYELAMRLLPKESSDGERVIGVAPGTEVSDDASELWRRFAGRADYHSEELGGDIDESRQHWHADDWLNAFYAPYGPRPPEVDRAVKAGAEFLGRLSAQYSMAPVETAATLSNIGDRLFRKSRRP